MIKILKNFLAIPFNSLDKKLWIIGIILFLASRLFNLTILPIFTDEAIYIRWSEIAWHANFSHSLIDPNQNPTQAKITQIPLTNLYLNNIAFNNARNDLFVPLSDGKQPLFMWTAILPMLLTSDHLWAGRLPSVVSGLAAFVGLWLLSYQLFKNKKLAYITSFVYLVLPFTFLYDRMMLADSMLAMWGIWALYLELKMLERPSAKTSIALGIVYGLGLLTKSPAIFYWVLAPVTLLLFKNTNQNSSFSLTDFLFWKWSKFEQNKLLKWIGFWIIAVLIGQAFQALLRFSQLYHQIGRKNLEFLVTNQEFLEKPFSMLYGNMVGTSTWFYAYIGLALVICCLIALIRGMKNFDKRILILVIFSTVPWIVSASMAKVIYPRYLLFFTPQILLLISYGLFTLNQFVSRILKNFPKPQIVATLIILNLIIFSYPIYFTALLSFNPQKAPMPLQDREQYVEGWPSGYGVEEVYQYLNSQLQKNGKIAVGTEGTFGLMPFSLQIKFYDEIYNRPNQQSRIFIDGYWPFINVPQKMVEYAVERPTYFVVYQNEKPIPKEYPLELVLTIKKPGDKTTMRLYKVVPVSQYLPEGNVIK